MTFHYKNDQKGTPQFGLIAEEVAEVNPNLVVRDKNGQILSVRYDKVWNAMLLNEFLKEQRRKQQELESKVHGREQESTSRSNRRAFSPSSRRRKTNRSARIGSSESERAVSS